MKTIRHTVKQATSKGSESKIKSPLMYEGFILKNKLTANGYKLSGYSYKSDLFINPLYNSFEAIKLIIDNLK